MNPKQHTLSDYIDVGRRFLRSVNLEKDYSGADLNGDYIITPTARDVLHRLSEGLAPSAMSRAWTLTGPYGVGKSSFAVFLTRLLCTHGAHGKTAYRHLMEADPRLARKVTEVTACADGNKGMLPVLVTARRSPAPHCIAEGTIAAISALKNRKLATTGRILRDLVTHQKNGEGLDSRRVVEALTSLAAASRSDGYSGVLLIVDELGKLFEYAARYPKRGDVYILQEMAEYAVRSGPNPLVVVGLLHQSFEEYGQHLDLATRREWAKIQGRFEDVLFLEPPEQVMGLIAQAIRWKAAGLPDEMKRHVRAIASNSAASGVLPPGMNASAFVEMSLAAYPLHPVSFVALPHLFRRFAQNERSLFSYLSSLEPNGFQEFIRTHYLDAKEPVFIRLPDLFDYFTRNFGLGLYRQPHARRWLEAADLLDRKENLTPLHRGLVKTIGILNAMGEFCHLRASENIVAVATEDAKQTSTATKDALSGLQQQSVVTFRRFNETYRIWEGSDVDVEERIAEGARKVRHGLDLAGSLKRYLPSRPLVARKHSFETGALRYFDIFYVGLPDDLQAVMSSTSEADGKIIVCLSESGAVADEFRSRAIDASSAGNVVFAIPQQIGELRAAVTELGALRWVWENTAELRDDRVARREVALRITEAEQVLTRNLGCLLDPRSEPIGSGCLWFHAGKQQPAESRRDVARVLSEICDRIYPVSPRIRNELIARRNLSSAAAAARRNLVERMLLHADEPLLGIEGYPPERSMYESVLLATGVHSEVGHGKWGFSSPSRSPKHHLLPCWKALHDMVFKAQPEPLPVTDVFAKLSTPPYGLREGLQPVILCAFMMAYRDEVTLYRERSFIPEPSVVDLEVLMRRPELFAIAGCHVTGGRAAVVERLAKGLHVKPATVPVVRALFRMVKGLPEFAWQTRRLPDTTIALREAFQNARSPERFLFVEVPQALKLPDFTDRASSHREVDEFFRALNANIQDWARKMPDVIASSKNDLLAACSLPQGDAGWQELRRQCLRVESSITETQLLAFVRRVIQAPPDDTGVQSVLALVANRPPLTWSDADLDRFPAAGKAMGQAFQTACRTVLKGSALACTYDKLNRTQKAEADFIVHRLQESPLTRKVQFKEALIAALEIMIEQLSNEKERK
jgi:hypothetical protein